MSPSGHHVFVEILSTRGKGAFFPNEPNRGMPVRMQSIRQILKWLSSAAEPGTCFVEESVNLLSPTVKPGSYLLLWSSHQHSAERTCSPFPPEIKSSDKAAHRCSPGQPLSPGAAAATRGCDRPEMGRRSPSLLINQVRQRGVAWILKTPDAPSPRWLSSVTPPSRPEHTLICQSDTAPLLSLL